MLKQLLLLKNKNGIRKGRLSNHLIDEIKNETDFPYLISFPRTGSHWLRLLLEKYTDRPLLVRSFFDHRSNDFLLYHSHDINLIERGKKILYLYRKDPVSTVYSLIKYYKLNPFERNTIAFYTYQYAGHLIHWTNIENYSDEKIVFSYEDMKYNPETTFKKILVFLNVDYEKEKFRSIYEKTTKSKVSNATERHDSNVVNCEIDYEENRQKFKEDYTLFISNLLKNYSLNVLNDKSFFSKYLYIYDESKENTHHS